jgi:hypothetical protein
MGTIMLAVSDGLFHPFPTLTELAAMDGAGSVGTAPVAVYVGRSVASPAWLIEVGGQARLDVTLAGMLPLPAVMEPVQGLVFLQNPAAVRGSLGIQPFSRPSW